MYPPDLALLIEDLTRLGRPPDGWLLEKVREGVIPDEAFRSIVGIRRASPGIDKPGEYWLPVPGWPPYDVSNLARVRAYKVGSGGQLSKTPVRCLEKEQVSGLDEPGGVLVHRGRKESITPEDLARRVFGPLWQPPRPRPPAPDPDPPGEVWTRIPGWPAYEVAPTGMVRSYHMRRAGLAAKPQRLLRPFPVPEIGPWVTLCDGHGVRKQITVADLVRLVYPEPEPAAPGVPNSSIAGRGHSTAPDLRDPDRPRAPAPGAGPTAESSSPRGNMTFTEILAEIARKNPFR